jgi:hypothetical protein
LRGAGRVRRALLDPQDRPRRRRRDAALAEATGADADDLAAMPSLLFDWEIRTGTTERMQEAMIDIGAVGYELPVPEDGLVDRTLALDAVGLRLRRLRPRPRIVRVFAGPRPVRQQ